MDRFRNESIRGTRLGWFRHVQRGKSEMAPDELLMSKKLFYSRFKTIRREPQRRKPSTLNSGMLEDPLATPAASKAREQSSTTRLTVNTYRQI